MKDNYITNKDPNYFGTPLKDYPERVKKIVDQTRREIEKALEKNSDIKKSFPHLLLLLA